jgi:hypothetical protein
VDSDRSVVAADPAAPGRYRVYRQNLLARFSRLCGWRGLDKVEVATDCVTTTCDVRDFRRFPILRRTRIAFELGRRSHVRQNVGGLPCGFPRSGERGSKTVRILGYVNWEEFARWRSEERRSFAGCI